MSAVMVFPFTEFLENQRSATRSSDRIDVGMKESIPPRLSGTPFVLMRCAPKLRVTHCSLRQSMVTTDSGGSSNRCSDFVSHRTRSAFCENIHGSKGNTHWGFQGGRSSLPF